MAARKDLTYITLNCVCECVLNVSCSCDLRADELQIRIGVLKLRFEIVMFLVVKTNDHHVFVVLGQRFFRVCDVLCLSKLMNQPKKSIKVVYFFRQLIISLTESIATGKQRL